MQIDAALKGRLTGTVLLYQLGAKEQAVSQELAALGLHCASVQRRYYDLPLEVLLGLKSAAALKQPPLGAAFQEPMLIMYNLSSTQVDGVLAALKRIGVNIGLKAVTTPTNLKWTSRQVYLMLQMERSQMGG